MNSILVLQLKRIGDVIATTPALRSLRALYPLSKITVLLDENSVAIAPSIAAQFNELWIYRKGGSLNLWMKLLSRQFDLVLDFTGNDRSALITFLSRGARRIGFRFAAKNPPRSWAYTGLVQSSVRDRHTVDHYLDLVASLGEIAGDQRMALDLDSSVERSAQNLKRQIGIHGSYFVVHPGSARREKFWLADRWAEVILYAQQRLRYPCIITGGPVAAELRHGEEILAALPPSANVTNLAGKIDFLLSAAIIRGAVCFVGVDTAAAHVAAAFERPELVLFGPTNPFHWRPKHPATVIVRAGHEGPLGHFEPRQPGAPMTDLSTDSVIRGMDSLFKYVGKNG